MKLEKQGGWDEELGIWKIQYETSLKRQRTRYHVVRWGNRSCLWISMKRPPSRPSMGIPWLTLLQMPCFMQMDAEGLFTWQLLLCAAAEMCRQLPAPQPLQIPQGVPMVKLWSFFTLLKKKKKLHKEKYFTLICLQSSSISMVGNASLRLPLLPESHHLKNSDKSPI